MKQKDTVKRYVIFILGLVFNAFGVAFVTRANLGTSPISGIPYILSLVIPVLSMGTWVVIFILLLILLQFLIDRKEADKVQLGIEIVISFCFGYGIDLSMFCLQALHPTSYPFQLASLIVGCCIFAFGAYLEVIADVVMLPGDAFVRAVVKAVKKEYGGIRVLSDISMTVIAGVICLVFLRKLSGVREGTVFSALLVGNMVKLFTRALAPLTKRLLPEEE